MSKATIITVIIRNQESNVSHQQQPSTSQAAATSEMRNNLRKRQKEPKKNNNFSVEQKYTVIETNYPFHLSSARTQRNSQPKSAHDRERDETRPHLRCHWCIRRFNVFFSLHVRIERTTHAFEWDNKTWTVTKRKGRKFNAFTWRASWYLWHETHICFHLMWLCWCREIHRSS